MKPIGICTTVVNRPRFLELQARLFRKYLRNAYEFHVVDDSAGAGLARRFEKICRAEGLHYHRKPTRFDGPDASMAAAQSGVTSTNVLGSNPMVWPGPLS